jgi:hypothetical protein
MKSLQKTLCLFTMLFSFFMISQQTQAQWSVGSDIMSRYVWRGMDFGASPSIQPYVEYSNSGFAVGAWGAYSVTGSQGQEADLYLSYTFLNDMITIGVTDYFFPNDLMADNYFNYKSGETGHLYEAALSFNGTENLPLSLLIATNFYGDDLDSEGNSRFSSYAELGYSLETATGVSIDVFTGANLTAQSAADKEAELDGFYGNKAGLINVGATAGKEIEITEKFSLPVSASLITNPMAGNIFFVFGISL